MKFEIDIMKGTVPMENEADLREVIFGNPYDVIEYSEVSDLMDEAEAREEFEKLQATARRTEDGMIEFMIPELVCGEDLDEDIDEETGEKFSISIPVKQSTKGILMMNQRNYLGNWVF